jgi:hypothetical protein
MPTASKRARAAQAGHDVRELLAERGGARGLAVRAREHGEARVLVRERAQLLDELVELAGEHDASGTQHACVGEIVDVLGRAAEVHELEHGGARAGRLQLLAHEVLHGLHVVVDARLDGLHGRGRVVAGLERERRRELLHGAGQRLAQQCGHGFREIQQPGGLDAHALADEPALGQHGTQRIRSLAITTVDRGQGGQRVL